MPGFVIVDKLVNNNNQPILDGGVNSFDFQTKESITKPNEKTYILTSLLHKILPTFNSLAQMKVFNLQPIQNHLTSP